MKLYPFDEVAQRVAEILDGTSTAENYLAIKAVVGDGAHVEVYQQFNCAACGMKQTMPDPNVLYTAGKCEECGAITNLRKYGCNYAVHYSRRAKV
jgi:hypothetical protein